MNNDLFNKALNGKLNLKEFEEQDILNELEELKKEEENKNDRRRRML